MGYTLEQFNKDVKDYIVSKDICLYANTPRYGYTTYITYDKDEVIGIRPLFEPINWSNEEVLTFENVVHYTLDRPFEKMLEELDKVCFDQIMEKQYYDVFIRNAAYNIDKIAFKVLEDLPIDSNLVFNKYVPERVTKTEHYSAFLDILMEANNKIYQSNLRHKANKLIIAADVIPVLYFLGCYEPEKSVRINGPYLAGKLKFENTLDLNVYVDPWMPQGEFVMSYVDNEAKLEVPYAIRAERFVETDSTDYKYSIKTLNPGLMVKGKVICEKQ